MLGRARRQASPYLDKARQQAGPFVDKAREQAGPLVERAREQAGPYVERARESWAPRDSAGGTAGAGPAEDAHGRRDEHGQGERDRGDAGVVERPGEDHGDERGQGD